MANAERPLIFISCGQWTEAEKRLGQDIDAWITSATRFCGYFAQNQTELKGVTSEVLGALERAVGFVGIMHHRGLIMRQGGNVGQRASVWIEQEVAIAAFIREVLQRPMGLLLYAQRGLALEGLREKLIANPIEFDTEQEVLDDLRSRFPQWSAALSVIGKGQSIGLELKHRRQPSPAGVDPQRHHDYRLEVWATNRGTTEWKEYRVEVEFPSRYLSDTTIFGPEVKDRRTPTHRFFRHTQASWTGHIIYPGDSKLMMSLDYFMTDRLFMENLGPARGADELATVSMIANGETTKVEKPFSELNNF